MKAKGTANDTNAYHVENECLIPTDIGVVELVTPEVSYKQHKRRREVLGEASCMVLVCFTTVVGD